MTQSDIQAVEQMYDADSIREWERLVRHRTEFSVTLCALADYLPPAPATILDVGGGPGRYAIELAKQGYQVTLLDLSMGNLNLAKAKAEEAGITLADIVHGNALNLSQFADEAFDVVLLFGPLYHLLAADERKKAVVEGMRVLRKNACTEHSRSGRFFSAFVTRYAPFRYAVAQDPKWLNNNKEYAEKLLATGVHDRGTGFVNVFFAHPTEITPFMESCGLKTLNLIGCEGVASQVEENVNQLEGKAWDVWVDFNYRMGQDPSLHGAAEHLLYIGEKS